MSTPDKIGGPGGVTPTRTRKDVFEPLPRSARDMSPQASEDETDTPAWREFAARYPLAARRELEDRARVAAVEKAQARALFARQFPGRPLPPELQDGAA